MKNDSTVLIKTNCLKLVIWKEVFWSFIIIDVMYTVQTRYFVKKKLEA